MDEGHPYPGLAPFQKEDTSHFFGREEEIERGVAQLLERDFLVVVGASGSGKTSLIQAGILTRLGNAHAAAFDPVVSCRFGAGALRNLTRAVDEIRSYEGRDGSKPLLVIDQFEELYLLSDEADRDNVLRELAALLEQARTSVLLGLRADSVSRLLEAPFLARRLEDSSIFLAPLSRTQLRKVILAPAQHAGIHFDEPVVDRILSDVGTTAGALPMLQVLLMRLARESHDGPITLSDYERIGTFSGVLDQVLDRVWASTEKSDRPRMRSLMLRLVTPERMRRALPLAELSDEDRPLVDRLVDARVLAVHHRDGGEPFVELAHDAIAYQWDRLAEWIEADRAFLELRRDLSEAAAQWVGAGHDQSRLLARHKLSEPRRLLVERKDDLSPLEILFITESLKVTERVSVWKSWSRALGLKRLEKEVGERDARLAATQHEVAELEQTLRELEAKRERLSVRLRESVKRVDEMAPSVFISYAKEDFEKVLPLYEKLKEQGLRPWLDREELLPGVEWEREIVKEINRSNFVLICLSKKSVSKRGYIQKELRLALEAYQEIPAGQTFLIPARIEECTVPDDLAKYQFVDLYRDGAFDKVLESIFTSWSESQFGDRG